METVEVKLSKDELNELFSGLMMIEKREKENLHDLKKSGMMDEAEKVERSIINTQKLRGKLGGYVSVIVKREIKDGNHG
jgi:hypothetical protein